VKLKVTIAIPLEIAKPEPIETELAALDFPNGIPTAKTATEFYEYLDLTRGADAFLNAFAKCQCLQFARASTRPA
jgi:hypothetical protein